MRITPATALVIAGAIAACTPEPPHVANSKGTPAAEIFADATESSGIRFRHVNGMSGEFYYPEILPGVALLDFNNDGKPTSGRGDAAHHRRPAR
jgi:hypothetical protein